MEWASGSVFGVGLMVCVVGKVGVEVKVKVGDESRSGSGTELRWW